MVIYNKVAQAAYGDVKIIDCTLRDGGYYNAWDFTYDLAKEYIESIAKAGVDCIEIEYWLRFAEKIMGTAVYLWIGVKTGVLTKDNIRLLRSSISSRKLKNHEE